MSFVLTNRSVYLVALIICFRVNALAQYIPLDATGFKDSLETVLSGNAPDNIKAQANFTLSYYWANTDTAKSWQYLDKALQSGKNNAFLRAVGYYYLGSYYQHHNKILAKSMYLKADSLLSRFPETAAYKFRCWSWHAYSKLVNEEDNDKERMNVVLNKALPMARLSGDSGLVGLCYGTMAIVFNNSVRLQKAEEYFLMSINHLKNSGYDAILVDIYARAARNYMAYVNRVTEDELEMKAVRKKLPLAKAMLDSARNLIGNHVDAVAAIEYYKFKGKYFRMLKQYKAAHSNLDSGMTIAKANNLPYEVEMFSLHKYQVYSEQGQFEKAKALILQLVQNPPTVAYKGNQQVYYYELSLTLARLGDFKNAYEWLIKTNKLGDSITDTHERAAIDAMEIKYQTAEREKRIISLESEKKQAVLSGKNNRLANWLLAVGCFLLLNIAGYSMVLYRKNKRISAQQLTAIQQQQELKLSQAMLTGQEEERNRVARDLHDGLGSMLAGVKISLSGIASGREKDHDQQLRDTIHQLDNSVSELRRIAHNIMPPTLLRYGLEASLRELCESLVSGQLAIDLQCLGIQQNLPVKEQLFIYRIVQELLSNAVKHADASNIMLQCSQDKNIFLITIEDDGKGFDAAQTGSNTGIGIVNIRNRVAYLNGTIELLKREAPHSGSIINIELHVTA